MPIRSVAELVPVLVTAIGPAVLVSAVGMLLLTLTNRLGRVIDRSRQLAAAGARRTGDQAGTERAQLQVLWKRARLIRLSITLASTSALCAALLVAAIFLTALFRLEYAWLVALLFVACMAALVGALTVFLRDVNLSLEALALETADALAPSESRDAQEPDAQ